MSNNQPDRKGFEDMRNNSDDVREEPRHKDVEDVQRGKDS